MRAFELRFILGSLLLYAWIVLRIGLDADALTVQLRTGPRIGFLFFALAFVARPLAQLSHARWTRALARYRRAFGITFGLIQLVHAMFIAAFLLSDAPPVAITVKLFGGIGLVLVYAMLLSSFGMVRKRMTPTTWGRLHTIGLYYVMGIYLRDWITGLSTKDSPSFYGPLLAVTLLCLGLRCANALRQRTSDRLAA